MSNPQPPIGLPWYGATFTGALARFWRSYTVFHGRATRSEFWWVMLWYFLLSVVVNIVFAVSIFTNFDAMNLPASADTPFNPFVIWADLFLAMPLPAKIALGVFVVVVLAALLPLIGLAARRLHATNRSGWWVLLYWVPLGNIVLVVFLLLDPDPRGERFDRH
jgi:uncharacterized membrane protein YhaH (DUF805 family)